MLRTSISVLAAALLVIPPDVALAQEAAPAPAAAQPASPQQLLSAGQLEALVSPIALYPDNLLAQVLMASTYPLEVVEAERWVSGNKALKGDALQAAASKQSWDDSVKSLTAAPDVLKMMSDQLSWTQQLGDAVLAQQPDVMDAIQRLRAKAQANNKLVSTQQQTVATQQENGQQVITIVSAQPDTVYVPYYDPGVVYGAWDYPEYPPTYWPNYWPGYIGSGLIGAGIGFGLGWGLGSWHNGCCWGGGVGWGNGSINVGNINRPTQWQHNSMHRQGVRYNNANVANRFGGAGLRGGAQNRMDFRGRGGNQVLRPGAGAGVRPGAGVGGRPGAGAGVRPGGGAGRPGGGQGVRPGGGAGRPGGGQGVRPGGGAGRPAARPAARPAGGARGPGAFGGVNAGRGAGFAGARGRASFGGGGGGGFRGGGGGGFRGGGGARMGGGGRGGGGRGGGGRRSDIRLKHDVVLLGRLNDGLGYYRFVYNGGHTAYVGVMAQEVEKVAPAAVFRGSDGYLRVDYGKLSLPFETYQQWLSTGAALPEVKPQAN